jgi:hypothetical protein
VLIDRRNFWKLHGRWLIVALVASALALAWCTAQWQMTGRWPGGGSLPGLVLGVLAAAIFLFEMALAAKKTKAFRTARWALSAQTWMKAHIWLGLLTVPLVILHSGGRLGGTLTTVLVIVFTIVILSGMYGLALQNFLPRLLLESTPAETIYSQIDMVGRQYAAEARRLVMLQCGADAEDVLHDKVLPEWVYEVHTVAAQGSHHVRGATRPIGPPVKRSPHPGRDLPDAIPAPAIRSALRDAIAPYLSTGANRAGMLGSRQRNQWYFDDLRMRVVPELRSLVGQLEELCERRRQLNVQRRLHFWLHNWLWIHWPLSIALMLLLVGHIFLALRFG